MTKKTEEVIAMSVRDYNKQILKRQRIKETTLIVGLDIGSKFNAMALMNKAGEVLGRYPKVYNSRRGFEYFLEVIDKAMSTNGLIDVIIGMEPTGHYWRKIAHFAKEWGFEVRFIRTTALKHQRELDLSSKAKSDLKDAIVIANIVREGKYIDTSIQSGVYRQLRTLSKTRERIKRYQTGALNALRAAVDDYFPELHDIFYSVKAKGLQAVLERCPFPEDALSIGVDELYETIRKASRRRKEALDKANQLIDAAGVSIGIKELGTGDRFRVQMHLCEAIRTEDMLIEIEREMERLLKALPVAEFLMSIRGVGVLSAAQFLGELGDPANFKNPKQIINYAGYDPVENDSGIRTGRKRISKKGRWLLRKVLYFMGLHVISNSAYFKGYYDEKLKKSSRFGRPISKKEAVCTVIIKLVKVIFALIRDERKFTEMPVKLALTA